MNSCLWKAVGFLEISYNKVEKENADLKRKMRVKKIVLIVIGVLSGAWNGGSHPSDTSAIR